MAIALRRPERSKRGPDIGFTWTLTGIKKLKKIMKYNAWTLALIGAGVVSLPAVAHSEENTNAVVTAVSITNAVMTALSSKTISGYVDTSAQWNPGTGNYYLPVYTPNGASGASKADGFNLDLVALTISKPVGEGDWGAGYNATLLFGPMPSATIPLPVQPTATLASRIPTLTFTPRWETGWI